MLVKARRRMVGNPRGVDEMLPKVVSAEGEVDRVRDCLDFVAVPLVFAWREILSDCGREQ
jgi:hypothetical protein